eukprot:3126459-Rhodomonas_salina.1
MFFSPSASPSHVDPGDAPTAQKPSARVVGRGSASPVVAAPVAVTAQPVQEDLTGASMYDDPYLESDGDWEDDEVIPTFIVGAGEAAAGQAPAAFTTPTAATKKKQKKGVGGNLWKY